MSIYKNMQAEHKTPAVEATVGLFRAYLGYTGVNPGKMGYRMAMALKGLKMQEKRDFTISLLDTDLISNGIKEIIDIFDGIIVDVREVR